MPSQRPRWGSGALSSLLTAGIMLTVVGCAHITPLAPNPGPPATAAGPPMRVTLQRLRSPFALRAARVSPLAPGGGCPAGYAALAVDTQYCFEEFGPTATVTAAGVSGFTKIPPAGQSGFLITVSPDDRSAQKAVTATAADAHAYLAITVAGRTWILPRVLRAFTGPLEIILHRMSQLVVLHRLLAPAS